MFLFWFLLLLFLSPFLFSNVDFFVCNSEAVADYFSEFDNIIK